MTRLAAWLARETPATDLQFCVTGHINGSYSLAAVNRGLACSLGRRWPVRVLPVEGQRTDDLQGVPPSERHLLQSMSVRRWQPRGQRVVISGHYPVHVPKDPADATLALFYWEETQIPIDTVRLLNRHFTGVLAPSSFVAKALVDSGVSVPVHMVGQAPDLADFHAIGRRRHPRGSREPFSFLHVSSCLPRKGVDVLLAGYVRAFRRRDAVRLLIKGYPNPHNTVQAQIDAIRAADPQAPEIVLINRDLGRVELLELYCQADAMVLPTRGEGFNLPAAEAMAARLPVIVTGLGGQSDFCTSATARLVDGQFVPTASHVSGAGSLWVEPSVDDLAAALREVRTGGDGIAARVHIAAITAETMMTEAALVDRIGQAAMSCLAEDATAEHQVVIVEPQNRSWNGLRRSLASAAAHNRRAVVVLSDTAWLPNDLMVLATAARVMVRDIADLHWLQSRGLSDNVVFAPDSPERGERLSGLLQGLRHGSHQCANSWVRTSLA